MLTYKLIKFSQPTNLSISTTWFLFNLVTTHVLHLWSLLLANLPAPLWKSQIAPFGMLHLVYGTNFPLIFASLVRHSLLHFHLTYGSSSSSLSSLSPLASFLPRSVFHSELKRLGSSEILSSVDLFLSYRTDSMDSDDLMFLFCSTVGLSA